MEEKQDYFRPSLKIKMLQENKEEKSIKLFDKHNHHQVETNSTIIVKEDNYNVLQCEGTSRKEISNIYS